MLIIKIVSGEVIRKLVLSFVFMILLSELFCCTFEYTGSGNNGSEYVWMGMNETGLAIANALTNDLQK